MGRILVEHEGGKTYTIVLDRTHSRMITRRYFVGKFENWKV